MSHFIYGSKQFTSVDQLSPIQKIQITVYLNFVHEGELTRKHQKQFCCDLRVLRTLQKCKVTDFIDKSLVPDHLSGEDYVFHPHLDNDYHPLDSGPVSEWDPEHTGIHLKWSDSDCFKLLLGLFEVSMSKIKHCTVGSRRDAYSDAIAYIQSDINRVFLQSIGLDHHDFCSQLPDYKIRFDRFNQQRNVSKANVEEFDPDDVSAELDSYSDEAFENAQCLDFEDDSQDADLLQLAFHFSK